MSTANDSEKSKNSDGMPAGSRQSESRAAVYGLLGAIIGGLATFGGAYWTGHQTESSNQISAERSAIIAFVSAAQQYELNLEDIPGTVQNVNLYGELHNTLYAEAPALLGDAFLVGLSSSHAVEVDAAELSNSLLSIYIPPDPKSLDPSAISKAENSFKKYLYKLEGDAEGQINPG
jgi:hypothetical protein